jgi:hypothetical protein
VGAGTLARASWRRGIAFAGTAVALGLLRGPSAVCVLAWLPLAVICVRRALDRDTVFYGALLGILGAAMIFGGDLPVAIAGGVVVLGAAATGVLASKRARGAVLGDAAGALVLAGIVAPGLAAVLLVSRAPESMGATLASMPVIVQLNPDRALLFGEPLDPRAAHARIEHAPLERRAYGRVVRAGVGDGALELEVPPGGAAMLTAQRTYSPGWHATSGRREVPLFCAEPGVLAISLPPGAQAVQLWFEPASLRSGMAMSLATLMVLLGVALCRFARRVERYWAARAGVPSTGASGAA